MNGVDIDTGLLRTFLTLAETGSFSRTAARVGRSQSAVSGQLQRLEALLGRRLVARDTRNVRLTPDGEQVLPHARALVAAGDAMLARFRTGGVAGTVRFGAPEDVATGYLPEVLAGFAAAYPQVELSVSCRLTLDLVAALEAGEADLVIVKQDPSRRIAGARPLRRERLVWAGRDPQAVAGLVPLVLSPAPCVYRARAVQALDAAHRPWRVVYSSQSFAGTLAAVRAGLGLTVLPEGMRPPDLAALGAGQGLPALPDAEIALLGTARMAPAVAALADHLAAGIEVASG